MDVALLLVSGSIEIFARIALFIICLNMERGINFLDGKYEKREKVKALKVNSIVFCQVTAIFSTILFCSIFVIVCHGHILHFFLLFAIFMIDPTKRNPLLISFRLIKVYKRIVNRLELVLNEHLDS